MTIVTLTMTASGHLAWLQRKYLIQWCHVVSGWRKGSFSTAFIVSKYYIWMCAAINGQIMSEWLGGFWIKWHQPSFNALSWGQWMVFIGVTNGLQQSAELQYLLHDQRLFAAWPQVIRKPWLHSLWMEFIGNGHISYPLDPHLCYRVFQCHKVTIIHQN